MRFTSACAVAIFGGALALGCAPGEDEVRAAFDAQVQASNACASDADCVVIGPGCPLGCAVAVRADQAAACERRAEELIADYERYGTRCEYDCARFGPAYCDDAGRCQVDPVF